MVQTVSKFLEKQGLTLRSGDWAVRGPRVQCILVTDWGGSSGESAQVLRASWSSRDSGTTSFVTCFGRGSPACVNGLGDGSSGFCDSFWGQRRVGNVQIPRPCSQSPCALLYPACQVPPLVSCSEPQQPPLHRFGESSNARPILSHRGHVGGKTHGQRPHQDCPA